MTLWSVVEPLTTRFNIEINGGNYQGKTGAKSLKSQRNSLCTRADLHALIKDLIVRENLALDTVSSRLGISLSTVRRACRTLKIGPNGVHGVGSIASRSSQAPFGWDVVHGHLKINKEEWKWVLKIRAMRDAEQSLHRIAAILCEKKVPTKNGGRWFAKTVSQILEFNRPQLDQMKNKRR